MGRKSHQKVASHHCHHSKAQEGDGDRATRWDECPREGPPWYRASQLLRASQSGALGRTISLGYCPPLLFVMTTLPTFCPSPCLDLYKLCLTAGPLWSGSHVNSPPKAEQFFFDAFLVSRAHLHHITQGDQISSKTTAKREMLKGGEEGKMVSKPGHIKKLFPWQPLVPTAAQSCFNQWQHLPINSAGVCTSFPRTCPGTDVATHPLRQGTPLEVMEIIFSTGLWKLELRCRDTYPMP